MQQPALLSAHRCRRPKWVIYLPVSSQAMRQYSESDSGKTVRTLHTLLSRSWAAPPWVSLCFQWLGLAAITGSVQFLAAITTDKATLPMATAVAPNSHFQLRACRQTRINECRADDFSNFYNAQHRLLLYPSRFAGAVRWQTSTNMDRKTDSPMMFWPCVSGWHCCLWGFPASFCTWLALPLSAQSVFSPAWKALRGWSAPRGRNKWGKKYISALLLCANPIKMSTGSDKSAPLIIWMSLFKEEASRLVIMRYKLDLKIKKYNGSLIFITMSTMFQENCAAFILTPSQILITNQLLETQAKALHFIGQ